ncbi:hypothetical protein QBC34DRAFT_402458 [Podospora aff. communis PSN243]|uniref:Uncharacterized protein n=1 Tax=Podospora aff. communis PSN243 TaxID=3040156 RepID=A0AAV9GW28_9PEZI|nr:hypothetical protein QBC34DRAFT_402458 [Podospora aff. communis PSN243]
MCTGTGFRLLCGHYLIHWDERCPQNCEKPSNPPPYLDDTCAACHAQYSKEGINRQFRDSLQIALAKREKAFMNFDTPLVREADEDIAVAHDKREVNMQQHRAMPGGVEEPKWPGKNELD